jgi:hypothetical protein
MTFALGLFLAVATIFTAIYFAWPTPQLGTDEQVRGEVDALFTAVTARDEKLLAQCESRIDALRSQSKLNEAVAQRLATIIDEARKGGWESAAKRLYKFIQSQRL